MKPEVEFIVKTLRDLADRIEKKGGEELESYHANSERTVQTIGLGWVRAIYKVTEYEIVTIEKVKEEV